MSDSTLQTAEATEQATNDDALASQLLNEVSDEALEAAASTILGIATDNAVCTGVCTYPKC